jgi:heterodisulfide reductase subunit A
MAEEQSAISDSQSPIRIGVVVCDCGKQIAGILDTEALCQRASSLPDVVCATREPYPCSKDGQARLLQAIHARDLNRVLVAGCSPRLMRDMFRRIGQGAGLARSFVNMANIREQCAYIHADQPATAYEKAAGLIEMGVARLATITAETPRSGRVVKSAMVIGSDLPGLTLATNLAEHGYRVTVIEHGSSFGETIPDDLLVRTRQQLIVKGQQVVEHPLIDVLFNARVVEMTGHPGDYTVRIQQGDQTLTCGIGAIIVANAAQPKTLGEDQWFDRARVKTQVEFEDEMDKATEPGNWLAVKDVVMIFCAEKSQLERCSRVCCNIGIRQAIRVKRLNPNANVTVLFRDLYLSGIGEAAGGAPPSETGLVQQARQMGVTFFRYRRNKPPVIREQTVDIFDTLTGEPLRLPYDRVVLTMPLVPQDNTPSLAAILGLPLDEDGFLAEPRVRLRPGRYAEPGIYALGSAQQPADTDEALFQAYLTSARVERFLSQDSIRVETPVAKIDPSLCTGCGNCPQVCPMAAIRLEKRDGILSLSEVDELRCFGCGNCIVVCPSRAISLPGWDDAVIPAQIIAALHPTSIENYEPKIIALACEWSAYAAADVAGARHIGGGPDAPTYPPNVRIIRTNCSARFDPYHILWAFLNGADGVFLGACLPGDCHYGSGNLYAQERVENLKKELAANGFDPRRLRLEFLTVDDGKKFAETMTEFVEEMSLMDKQSDN